jgi:signal transduction histidine kinase
MPKPDLEDQPDQSLLADILTPLFIATVLFALVAIAWVSGSNERSNYAAYLFPAALLLITLGARVAQQSGRARLAGIVMAVTLGILPLLTVLLLGLDRNPFIFVAPLGVLLGMIVGSLRVGITIVAVALLLLLGALLTNLTASLIAPTLLAVLLIATAALSGWAADAMYGTIEWALDTSAKSERRETLLRLTQAELQQAIYERDRLNTTLQNTNRELEAARAAAEAAYRSKASFMATMSHELRTPLNLIIGFSNALLDLPEMYEDQMLPDLYRADIAAIRSSGKHLLGLINDILDLAKVEAGKLELNMAPLAMEPLIDEVMKHAAALLMNRPVELRREVASDLPPVLADEVRMRQVLLNLLSNASKFTNSGEISVGARANTSHVMLWVRDSGIGIAPDDQARIFGQFEQVESHDSRQRGGTGLGLSICRWLVELHGGRMGVKSEVGRGSIFYFTLPILGATDLPPADARLEAALEHAVETVPVH